MGFLSTLFKVGGGFLTAQLQAKQNKQLAKSIARRAPTGLFNKVPGDLPRRTPTQVIGPPIPSAGQIRGVLGPGSAVPPWHAAVHAGLGRKRRRMNHTNFSALKRALRRVEGFTKVVKRAEKSLRKIAPPRRSSSTRKLIAGPGHTHERS